jgi:hypothetical protein
MALFGRAKLLILLALAACGGVGLYLLSVQHGTQSMSRLTAKEILLGGSPRRDTPSNLLVQQQQQLSHMQQPQHVDRNSLDMAHHVLHGVHVRALRVPPGNDGIAHDTDTGEAHADNMAENVAEVVGVTKGSHGDQRQHHAVHDHGGPPKAYIKNSKIPAIIHQTWKSKEIPLECRQSVQSWKRFNPSYEYVRPLVVS